MIETKDLQFSYPADEGSAPVQALRGVDLKIEKGSYVAILGHNGCGKSTLAKLLCGILLPTDGQILIDGIDTADEEKSFEIRKRCGMVFQNPDNQLVASVVEEDVAFAPENLGLPREEIRRRVDAALATVDMTEYAKHATYKLSGGQKQRIAIAGMLAMSPECIVFDEATAMLDPTGRKEIVAAMKRLNSELGLTVVTITHYMNEAAQADRIIVVDGGNIIADGTPREVFDKDELLYNAGLEAPQSANLVKRLKNAGADITETVLNAEEAARVIGNAIK